MPVTGKRKDKEMQENSIKFNFTWYNTNNFFLEVIMWVAGKKELQFLVPENIWLNLEARKKVADELTHIWWLKKQGREN